MYFINQGGFFRVELKENEIGMINRYRQKGKKRDKLNVKINGQVKKMAK